MPNLAKLRHEHAMLMDIVRRLEWLVAQPAPPAQTELFALRRELSSNLVAHLKMEDWVLYPRLLASGDEVVAKTARTFSEQMGGLASAYSAYAGKWGAVAIEHDWAGYCEATRDFIGALTCRIGRENRELYPLLESINKAA